MGIFLTNYSDVIIKRVANTFYVIIFILIPHPKIQTKVGKDWLRPIARILLWA
jgi:hypothetical protein